MARGLLEIPSDKLARGRIDMHQTHLPLDSGGMGGLGCRGCTARTHGVAHDVVQLNVGLARQPGHLEVHVLCQSGVGAGIELAACPQVHDALLGHVRACQRK